MSIRTFLLLGMVGALLGGCQAVSRPPAPEFVLLGSEEEVRSACAAMAWRGITCRVDGVLLEETQYRKLMMPVASQLWDQSMKVVGVLDLTTHVASSGFRYFSATGHQEIYRRDEPDAVRRTQEFDQAFWGYLAQSFRVARVPPDDPRVSQFIAASEQRVRQEQERLREQQRLEARKAIEEAERARLEAARRAYEKTDAYKAERAREAILDCRATMAAARESIAWDNRVADISGYENRWIRRRAAVDIVQCQDLIPQYWREYKQYGGKARSIGELGY
ncbi:hypothetical protein APB27_02840 [Pseudomonas aeruginosa]|uniref:hypothetical protein n=1 Tax=Pseudomonas aeruginosa group TaxID=136841 RepID=UPI00071B8AFE|nr:MULTISPECIES: hypothetical protein [Pseudomonas aeruginosa group]KSP94787.1 hypothetical protein APB27_02840 [Pseudomonas aeruginosa]MCW8022486.1 hypothetical protein [Pseudomonas aeruginosa]RTT41142.1 hypothetical protein DY956_03735 [Pseudomonas paraeruginosa]